MVYCEQLIIFFAVKQLKEQYVFKACFRRSKAQQLSEKNSTCQSLFNGILTKGIQCRFEGRHEKG